MKLKVKLSPGARQNAILEWEEDLFGEHTLKCAVCELPEKGKANRALIALLAKKLKIAKSDISIKQGLSSRLKIIEIQGLKKENLILDKFHEN